MGANPAPHTDLQADLAGEAPGWDVPFQGRPLPVPATRWRKGSPRSRAELTFQVPTFARDLDKRPFSCYTK
jgi:hypothetical protein